MLRTRSPNKKAKWSCWQAMKDSAAVVATNNNDNWPRSASQLVAVRLLKNKPANVVRSTMPKREILD